MISSSFRYFTLRFEGEVDSFSTGLSLSMLELLLDMTVLLSGQYDVLIDYAEE